MNTEIWQENHTEDTKMGLRDAGWEDTRWLNLVQDRACCQALYQRR